MVIRALPKTGFEKWQYGINQAATIASHYNVGDSHYAKKFDYALNLIRKGRWAICTH